MQGRTSSQQIIRDLFGLLPDEGVLDDFSCALKKKIYIHGRLFCTDNNICFYANILGFKTKQIIPFQQITSMKKTTGGFCKAIDIECGSNKHYIFSHFIGITDAFSFLHNLWRSISDIEDATDVGNWSDGEEERGVEEKEDSLLMLPEDQGPAHETLKTIIHMSSEAFFQAFISEEASFSFKDYWESRDFYNISCTPWSVDEEFGGCTRDCMYELKLTGSFGPSSTRMSEVHHYTVEDNRVILKVTAKALDVPYSTYFQIDSEWAVTQLSNTKSLLRTTALVNFTKSTMLRKTIESRSMGDSIKGMECWLAEAKRRKILPEPPAPKEKPQEKSLHQVAKYEEVDPKMLKKSAEIILPPPKSNALIYLNTVGWIVALLYLCYLHSRITVNLDALECE